MGSLLPSTSDIELDTTGERWLQIGEDATDVIDALQSETAQNLLASLHQEPATASALARINDASIQTVCYHLDNLRDAELVRVVDQWYSPKGREMNVYAPTTHRVILSMEEG